MATMEKILSWTNSKLLEQLCEVWDTVPEKKFAIKTIIKTTLDKSISRY